ncbi:MAG: YraN family protein [Planctomycetes bacterium]|nr:YraN family protein [Planctomycetota bacterium]
MLWVPGFRKKLLSDRRKLGRWGESRCEKFLKNQGYRFVARNFNCKYGEIDLIFMDNAGSAPGLVFVEVKTRRREISRKAQESVGYHKRRRIGYTAKHFIRQYQIKDKPLRFDVIAIIVGDKGTPQIRHYKNAFVP